MTLDSMHAAMIPSLMRRRLSSTLSTNASTLLCAGDKAAMLARFQEVQHSLQKRRAELSAAKGTHSAEPSATSPSLPFPVPNGPAGSVATVAPMGNGAVAGTLPLTPVAIASLQAARQAPSEDGNDVLGAVNSADISGGGGSGSGKVSIKMTAGAVRARGGVRHSAMAGVLRRLRAEEPASPP